MLSGFSEQKNQVNLHKNDLINKKVINRETGEYETIPVPICEPQNFGEDMAMDDKNIGGEGYTIISNKKTKKIALLIQSVKSENICEALKSIPIKILYAVKTITKDMAETYDWVARTMFLGATRINDKFHVIALALESLQDIRVRYRQEILREERLKKEEKKAIEREKREMLNRQGKTLKKEESKITTPVKKYENGETKKEILARSRYLLFKFEKEWRKSQKERAEILFREFPEMHKAYKLICGFRAFYRIEIGSYEKAKRCLKEWYEKVSQCEIDEIINFASTVQNHESEILNYFDCGQTNAFAESLNSKIQSFIKSNSGTRDLDFFHFRMKKYFS